MSFALVFLVAIATAMTILVLVGILSKLVRAAVGGAEPAPAQRQSFRPEEEEPVPAFDDEPISPFASELAGMPDEPPIEFRETPLEPHVPPGRSVPVKYLTRSKDAPDDVGVGEEAQSRRITDDDGNAYVQLGEDVTAVLTAAERAAAQIRDAAVKEAEQTRLIADENAAATLADAQAVRAEADEYSEETRSAANDYARVTRGHADESVARTLGEAEEQAHLVLADAEDKANQLIADAVRRRDALTKRTEDIEGRIESMLMSAHGVTSELEAMLSLRGATATTGEPASDEPLDDALTRAAAHRLTRTDADR